MERNGRRQGESEVAAARAGERYPSRPESERYPLKPAARYIGDDLSPHTLRSWAREGRIPYYRVGRRLFFAKADLDAFLRRHRVEAR
jgi:excisionase family DNA binding protein